MAQSLAELFGPGPCARGRNEMEPTKRPWADHRERVAFCGGMAVVLHYPLSRLEYTALAGEAVQLERDLGTRNANHQFQCGVEWEWQDLRDVVPMEQIAKVWGCCRRKLN